MNDIISVDREKIQTLAGSFDQESAAVQQVITNINRNLDMLRNGGWIADAATAFYQQMDGEVMVAVNRLRAALTLASQTTREINAVMDSAEDEACSCLPTE